MSGSMAKPGTAFIIVAACFPVFLFLGLFLVGAIFCGFTGHHARGFERLLAQFADSLWCFLIA